MSAAARAYAEEQLKRINEAYEVLSKPEGRAAYDAALRPAVTMHLVQRHVLLRSALPHTRPVHQHTPIRQADHHVVGLILTNHRLPNGMPKHGQSSFSSRGSAASGSGSQVC